MLQLTDEGVAQLFTQYGGNKKIIGCVGELQFEVIQYRLLHEYGASVQFNALPFYKACWITSNDPRKLEDFTRFKHANIAADKDGLLVYLAQSEWFLRIRKGPTIRRSNFILRRKSTNRTAVIRGLRSISAIGRSLYPEKQKVCVRTRTLGIIVVPAKCAGDTRR